MSTAPPSGDSTEPELEHEFAEVTDAAAVLRELPDLARAEAWASSVLGVWAEAPDAAAIDAEFIDWLDGSPNPNAPLLLVVLSGLHEVGEDPLDRARARLQNPPSWALASAPAVPVRAWTVVDREVRSLGIAFRLGDASEYSVLADIADELLTSLIIGPGPDELFDGAEDLVQPTPVEVADAAEQVERAWVRLVESHHPTPESVYVNGSLAAARLREVVGRDLVVSARPEREDEPLDDAIDSAERTELNGWAVSVLDGSGVGPGVPGPEALVDPLIPARAAQYPAAEREAFGALEWADWLGAVIGLCREAPGVVVEPAMLVDLINRCPEVTSTIPKNDRAYFEWAFSLVLPLWRRAGVVDADNALAADGAAKLVDALRRAWG